MRQIEFLNIGSRPCCDRHMDEGTPKRCWEIPVDHPDQWRNQTEHKEFIAQNRFRSIPAWMKEMME